MKIIANVDGYSGKEWKDKNTNGREKHRIYVVGPSGEIGYFDMKLGEFHISPKSETKFGVTSEQDAKLTLESASGFKVHLGDVLDDTPNNNEARTLLQEAVEKFGTLTTDADNMKVEINLGPTIELRMNGRSHWAKANLTVSVENTEANPEELYDVVSDMASAMLDLEIERLTQR